MQDKALRQKIINLMEKNISSVKDFDLDSLKKFISNVKKERQDKKVFNPERLKNLRKEGLVRRYNSGLSS